MAVQQLGQHRRRHMGVDMRRVDAGRPRRLDLRAQLSFRGFRRQMPAQACDITPKETVVIDQARGAADRRTKVYDTADGPVIAAPSGRAERAARKPRQSKKPQP